MIIFSNEDASADHSLYAAAIRVVALATYSEWSAAKRIAAVCIPRR